MGFQFVARRIPPRCLVGVVLFVILFASPLAAAPARAEAARVRILLLSDRSGDAKEKQRRAITLNRLRSVLKRSLGKQGLGKRYTLEVLAGPRITPASVLNYYRRLRTGPNETLVFYGNAHGATDPRQGLYLHLAGQKLFRAGLKRAMLRKRPRLIVILTDTCAGVPRRREPKVKIKPWRPSSRRRAMGNGLVLRQLFFQHRGIVEINAAKMGYKSYGNTKIGDFFTRALGNLIEQRAGWIDRNKDGFVTWSEFYKALDREARRVSAEHGLYQPAHARSLARRDTSRKRVPALSRRAASVGRSR
jgi:hypothetical protein